MGEGRLRPEWRWIDSVNVDLRLKEMSVDETPNRDAWMQLVRSIDPT